MRENSSTIYEHMKSRYGFLFAAVCAASVIPGSARTALLADKTPILFAAEDTKSDAGPSEEIIRKLAAMMPDQTFKRGEKQISKGGTAPEGTTVYPVQILNADGKLAFDANFFQEAGGKWALFDNFGNVARMPE
jgi:hypothetical protein